MAATSEPEQRIFNTEEELAISLAKYTAELSEKCVNDKGAFTVVLSGGCLINNIRKLAGSPFLESIQWANWHVFWVDQSVVPKDHVHSSYKLGYNGFLSKVPIPPAQIYAMSDALPAEDAADDYEAQLNTLVNGKVLGLFPATGFPRFDLMLLGMGPDGHIASLFPDHPLLDENQRWVTYIKDSPKPPIERITFTLPVINASSNIAMVVTGVDESVAVDKALGNGGDSDVLPIQMVKQEVMTWFLDKDAASKL